jgi:hypothetical protein
MEKYHYMGIARLGALVSHAVGLAVLVVAIVLSAAIPIYTLRIDTIGNAGDVVLLSCLSLWALFVLGLVGMGLMNSYPTVWIADDYLEISAFVFARVRIAWSDIIDVGAGKVPWGFVLVRAKRITVFHRWYGWQYSRTLLPSFMIGPQIEAHDELIREIRRRAQHANWQLR